MPELSEVKVKISTEADGKGIDEVHKKISAFGDKVMDASKVVLGAMTAMAGAAVVFGGASMKAYQEAEAAQKQLEHAVIAVTGATQGQLEETMKLADALEAKGVLDGDNIKTGLAQLSTFGLSNKAVQSLGGSLADLAVNQFGVNASGEQLTQSANMIAKALNGQFGVLEKSGIRFTETQKAIIEFGTEQEKVAAINEGFAQNLKYTNEVARQTGEGGLAHMKVQMGNIQEAIGKLINNGLAPIVNRISNWIDSMGGADAIVEKLTKTISDNKEVIIGIGIALGILAAVAVVAFVVANAAIIGIIAAVVLIGAGIGLLVKHFQDIGNFFVNLWTSIGTFFTNLWNGIKATIQGFVDWIITYLVPIFEVYIKIITLPWVLLWDFIVLMFAAISLVLQKFGEWLGKVFGPMVEVVWNGIKIGLNAVGNFFKTIWDGIKNVLQIVGDWLSKTFGPIVETVWTGLKNGLSKLKEFWQTIWEGMSSFVKGIAEKITGFIKNLVNGVIGFFNKLIDGANSVGSKVPGFIHIPNIPTFANGVTNFSGGVALVGERGPELVTLPRGSNVIPNDKMGGSSIQQYNYIYNQIDMDLALNNLAYAIAKQ